MPKRIIYVAGPYRAPTEYQREQNIIRARDAALALWSAGWSVICPHTNSAHMGGIVPDEAILDGDLEIVRRVDAVFMLRDYLASEGACMEHAEAFKCGKQVCYETEGIPRP